MASKLENILTYSLMVGAGLFLGYKSYQGFNYLIEVEKANAYSQGYHDGIKDTKRWVMEVQGKCGDEEKGK